jgi:radical SAM superfamily enzyme YgiQ (UPF0313 family)
LYQPDLILFSSFSNEYPFIKVVARRLKNETRATAVIGGIHASALPELVLQDGFDAVCVGEGEGALLELVGRLAEGRDFQDLPNLCTQDAAGAVRKNPVRPLIQDLDQLPLGEKDLFYRAGVFRRRVDHTFSRDCPFSCSYCCRSFLAGLYPQKQKHFRRKSVSRALEELSLSKAKYRPKTYSFLDDVFTLDETWLEEFVERYRREIGIPFGALTHPHAVTPAVARLLKRGGCSLLDIGVQTANEELRKTVGRYESNATIFSACRALRNEGIKISLQWINGFPGETPETMKQTREMSRALKPDYNWTTFCYPFPGTKLLGDCIKGGLIGEEELRKVREGYGSYQQTLLIRHPYRDMATAMKYYLPLSAHLPAALSERLFQLMLKRRGGLSQMLVKLVSIPLMDLRLAAYRLTEAASTAWRFWRT